MLTFTSSSHLRMMSPEFVESSQLETRDAALFEAHAKSRVLSVRVEVETSVRRVEQHARTRCIRPFVALAACVLLSAQSSPRPQSSGHGVWHGTQVSSPSASDRDYDTQRSFGSAVAVLPDALGPGRHGFACSAPEGDAPVVTILSESGEVLAKLEAPQKGLDFGRSLAPWSSVDGKQFGLFVGAPNRSKAGGSVYFARSPEWRLELHSRVDSLFVYGAALDTHRVAATGQTELLVGAPNWNSSDETSGTVFVYPLAEQNTSRRLNPPGLSQKGFGASVAVTPDIDGDRIADHLVLKADRALPRVGEATAAIWLFSGKNGDPIRSITSSSPDEHIVAVCALDSIAPKKTVTVAAVVYRPPSSESNYGGARIRRWDALSGAETSFVASDDAAWEQSARPSSEHWPLAVLEPLTDFDGDGVLDLVVGVRDAYHGLAGFLGAASIVSGATGANLLHLGPSGHGRERQLGASIAMNKSGAAIEDLRLIISAPDGGLWPGAAYVFDLKRPRDSRRLSLEH